MTETSNRSNPLICVANDPNGEIVADRIFDNCRLMRLDGLGRDELLDRFDQTNPDCAVLILDSQEMSRTRMGHWTELRQYCELRHIPFVVVTSAYDREMTGLLMADAVFRQPIDPSELRLHIGHLMERRWRILEQILIDPVTGAYNYRYIQREIQKQILDRQRSYQSFSLVYLEIDAASRLDSDGRRSANKALADFIQASVRPMDCLGRYAENGFVLVLPKTVKADAMKLMARLTSVFPETHSKSSPLAPMATFSAKVRDFNDSDLTAEECLSLMPFSESDPTDRAGLVLDGTLQDTGGRARKLMIAVIDDDRLIREMLKHQLADIGTGQFDVDIRDFSDGEDFFNDPWHRQNEQYVLIIDRIMPKMDGLEVLHRIRNGYDRRRYVCIMLSSKGAETDITLAIQRGANDYMVKPFRMKELRARVQRLVGGSQ